MDGFAAQTELSASAEQYVRRSRRARWLWRDQPAARVAALQQEARRADAAVDGAHQERAAAEALERSAATLFARQVSQSLEYGVLRYSLRRKLLAQALAHGLERFEANLIIASVQHQSERRAPAAEKKNAKDWSVALKLAAALAGEAIVIAFLMWR